MKITLELDYQDAVELCAILAKIGTGVAVDVASRIQDDIQSEEERSYERDQASLMESGGPDDSKYRQDMCDAGRGHLLR